VINTRAVEQIRQRAAAFVSESDRPARAREVTHDFCRSNGDGSCGEASLAKRPGVIVRRSRFAAGHLVSDAWPIRRVGRV
jgi:hypothetical protein